MREWREFRVELQIHITDREPDTGGADADPERIVQQQKLHMIPTRMLYQAAGSCVYISVYSMQI